MVTAVIQWVHRVNNLKGSPVAGGRNGTNVYVSVSGGVDFKEWVSLRYGRFYYLQP